MQTNYRYDGQSIRRLGALVQILLVLFMAVTALLGFYALFLATREMQEGFSLHLFTLPTFALIVLAAFAPAAVAITLWVWRAHANLHANRLEDLKFSPGWAALSLWAPFTNLIVPMGAMRQLWNRSHGEPAWFANQSVDKVTSWWTAYVVGIVLMTLLTSMALLDRFTNLAILSPPGTNTAGFGLASLLLAASAWFLLRLVDPITKAQQSSVALGSAFE